jgi:hypothetical protein
MLSVTQTYGIEHQFWCGSMLLACSGKKSVIYPAHCMQFLVSAYLEFFTLIIYSHCTLLSAAAFFFLSIRLSCFYTYLSLFSRCLSFHLLFSTTSVLCSSCDKFSAYARNYLYIFKRNRGNEILNVYEHSVRQKLI